MGDARKMPRSKSVPKPPFSMFSPPSSSDSVKKVPMNKIVLKNTPPPNLKKVKSKVSSLTNTNHKIESRKLNWNAQSKVASVAKPGPKPVEATKKVDAGGGGAMKNLKERVAKKRSLYQRAWAAPPPL